MIYGPYKDQKSPKTDAKKTGQTKDQKGED